MVSFDDERWNHLTGGYKIPFDPRPCLRKLENQKDRAAAWEELWMNYTTKAMLEMHHTLPYLNSSGCIASAARLGGISMRW